MKQLILHIWRTEEDMERELGKVARLRAALKKADRTIDVLLTGMLLEGAIVVAAIIIMSVCLIIHAE
jgi:hypothetical protein